MLSDTYKKQVSLLKQEIDFLNQTIRGLHRMREEATLALAVEQSRVAATKAQVESLEIKMNTFLREKKKIEDGFFLKNVDLREREQKLKRGMEKLSKEKREHDERLSKIEDRIRVAERLEKEKGKR